MNRWWPVILLLVCSATVVRAQDLRERPRFARIRAAQELFISEKLELTSAEAERFFPLYWEYEFRRRGLGSPGWKAALANVTSEEEARALLLRRQSVRKEKLALQSEAEEAYLRVIPATKVLLLESAEVEFRKKLLERLRRAGKQRK